MTQYELWCSLEISHSYYRDNICRNLNLVPDQNTVSRLQRYGLRWFQSAANEWQLWCPAQLDLADFISGNPSNKLVFKGVSSDPNFIQFTQFPVDQLGYYEFSTEGLQQITKSKINIPGKFNSKASISNSVAIIDLDLGVIKSKPTQYLISFEARKTRWQYYVIKQEQFLKGSLRLQGESANLFTGPELTKSLNDLDAECFDSTTNLLALQELGAIELSLLIQKEGRQSTTSQLLVEYLPNPNPGSLSSAQDGGTELISAMYIYV